MIPADDLLAETYRAFRRSEQLRERFEEMEEEFDKEADATKVPGSSLKGVGKSEFWGGLAIAQKGSRLA